jgi:hypothetical protein
VAEAWPGAELMVTHGLGHHRGLKDAGVIARAAAFVAGEHEAPGCGHSRSWAWDGRGELCPACALDQDLFDRGGRWARAEMDRIAARSNL